MGGLVSSYYLAQGVDQRNKVDKHISIGTPYLGAAKMVDVFYNGNAVAGSLEQLFTSGCIKDIIGNLQSIYGLLPYEKYFSPYLILFSEVQNSYGDTINFLNSLPGWNDDLYTSVVSNQNNLFINDRHISSYVDSYYIVGSWHSTIDRIKVYFDSNFELEIGTFKTEYGDETVTLYSATIAGTLDPNRVFYMYDNNDLNLEATHTKMIESTPSLNFITAIIDESVSTTTDESYLSLEYGVYKTNRIKE